MRSKTSKKTGRKSKPEKPQTPPPLDQAKVAQVLLWMVQGQTPYAIKEAAEATWPDTQPELLQDAAIEQLARATEFNPKVARGWCLEAYRELHRRMIELGDYAAAVRVVARVEAIVDDATKRDADKPAAEETTANQETDEARAHLAPLFADGDATPLPELCRLAATELLHARAQPKK